MRFPNIESGNLFPPVHTVPGNYHIIGNPLFICSGGGRHTLIDGQVTEGSWWIWVHSCLKGVCRSGKRQTAESHVGRLFRFSWHNILCAELSVSPTLTCSCPPVSTALTTVLCPWQIVLPRWSLASAHAKHIQGWLHLPVCSIGGARRALQKGINFGSSEVSSPAVPLELVEELTHTVSVEGMLLRVLQAPGSSLGATGATVGYHLYPTLP